MEIVRVINASKPLWVLVLNCCVLVLLSQGGRRVVLHPSVCTASVPDTTKVHVVSEGESKATALPEWDLCSTVIPGSPEIPGMAEQNHSVLNSPKFWFCISRSAGVQSKVLRGAGVSNKHLELWESSDLGAELCFRVGHPLLYKHAQVCWKKVVVVFPFGRQGFWHWEFLIAGIMLAVPSAQGGGCVCMCAGGAN